MTKTSEKTFYDIEHDGDAQQVYAVITKHGGIIIDTKFNNDAEQLTVIFKHPDDFYEKVHADTENEDAQFYFPKH